MKRLIILLAALVAVGGVSIYMLNNHAGMQKELPTSYEEVAQIKEDGIVTDDAETTAPEKNDPLAVSFSHSGTFYSETIEVELTCPEEGAVIYYTTNGNDPDEDSKKYTSPIKINAKSDTAATTVKAIAVNGADKSEIALKSYVVGKNVDTRFSDDTLVFVLSSDEYNLYDYYYGIAVEGYLRDKFLKEEYTGGEIKPTDPANYNIGGRESERPMYVEVYNSKGEQLISQAAGARVVGGYSRANDQKSFRLIARNSYSEGNGKFKYPFFRDARDAYGGLLTRYDRITLRDGANDREFAGLRDELSMVLSEQAGFPDVQNVRPAAVFLNSKYYGFSWLHEAYSDDYLEMQYGGNKDNYRIIGAKELDMTSDNEEDQQALEDWEHVLDLAKGDLTIEKNFKEFCSLVDIDNLMMYYAIQIYIDNKDWPGNNFKVWKYYPSEGEKVTSEYLDGRWRFLLFDAEYAWSLYGNGYKDDTLSAVLWGPHMQGQSEILMGLLGRWDMSEKFINTMCELMYGAFSEDNVIETLEMLEKSCDPELMYALKNGYVSTWANEWSFADSRNQIVDFAKYRSVIIERSIKKIWELSDDKYDLIVKAPTGADIKLVSKTVKSGEQFTVRYFTVCSGSITALPYDGYDFGHWEINGVRYDTPEVKIGAGMASDGRIQADLYLERTENTGEVCVSELYTGGDGDWIELYNPSSEPVNVKGYYLSDNAAVPDKYKIPDLEIPAGGVVTIVCKNNSEQSALMKHQTNFSLKTGETLYFSDPDLNLISTLPVLEMSPDESLSLAIDGRYYIGIITEGTKNY